MQALIAFGPDLKDLDGVLAQARTRGLTTRSSARASGLEGLSGALAPCMLLFSHLVPGKGRKPITDADVKSWESRFEPRLAPILNRAKFDKVSYQFVATKDTGNVTLNLQFASIDAAQCQFVAIALEEAYLLLGGKSAYTS